MRYTVPIFFIQLFLFSPVFGQEEAPFHAGFMTLHTVDSSRVYKPGTSKTEQLHLRPLDLDIWYPAIASKGNPLRFGDLFQLFEQRATAYQDEVDYTGMVNELAQLYVAELGVGGNSKALLDVVTRSYENLEIATGKFPLILYMAGFNGMGFENFRMLERLAETGCIVVSISSIGRYPGDMTNERGDIMEQVYDAEFALKVLEKEGRFDVDTSKIGVLGVSWGSMGAAILVNRNPNIMAMVSWDGSETHYYGESDTNLYANDATGADNDRFIREIYEANLLNTENQKITYLYFESGDKLNEFTPTDDYQYYQKLNTEKYYLRFKNSEHAHFSCIPAELKASDLAVTLYEHLEKGTTTFFDQTLKGSDTFKTSWSELKALEYTTTEPYDISDLETTNKEFTELLGTIVDSKSNQPLSYVNIGILNREVGTVSDTLGNFELAVAETLKNDTLRISRIGYQPIEILVKEVWKTEDALILKLDEQISALDEIVLTAKAIKKRTLGNKTESKFLGTGFGYDQLGAEMGIKINIRKNPTLVDAFNCTVSQNRLSAKAIFRLNFYSVQNGKPHENVLTQNILIPIEPKQTGPITVDLKPFNIVLEDDVIVTLEWVANEGDNKEGEAIFFPLGLFTNGTLYKASSQSKFRKYGGLGVGFNIDVRI